MLTNWKIIVAVIAVLFGISGYINYIWSIFRRGIKPHAFSWLVWGTLMSIGFAIQFSEHAGAGSWPMGLGGGACLLIFGLALAKGNRHFSQFDWMCLGLALLGILLWATTHQPLVAAVLIVLADAIGYGPTYRKGFRLPREENLAPFALSILISSLSIVALENYELSSWLYPASLVLTNIGFVTMILLRRRARAAQTTRSTP